MRLKIQAIAGVKWTGFSIICIGAFQIISQAVLGRYLATSDFGLMAMVITIIGFAQAFADMGIGNSIISKLNPSPQELSSLYWLSIILGIVFFITLWVLAPLAVLYYREPRLCELIRVLSFVFLITPIGRQFRVLLQKELFFKAIAKIEVTSSLIATILSLYLAISGAGIYALIFWQLGYSIVATIMLTYVGARRWKPELCFNRVHLKDHLGFGLFQTGETFLNTITSNIDYILIGRYLGPAPLGLYSVARQLVSYPLVVMERLTGRVLYSLLAAVQKDERKFKESYTTVFHYNLMFLLPVFVLLFQFAEPVILAAYGQKWVAAASTLKILCLVNIVKSLGLQGGAVLLSKGKANLSFYWKLIWTPFLVLTCLAGIYYYHSIESVAWSILIALLSVGSIWHYMIIRVGNIDYVDLAKKSYSIIIATFGMTIAIPLVSLVGLPEIIYYLSAGSVASMVYIILYRWVDRTHYNDLKEMVLR